MWIIFGVFSPLFWIALIVQTAFILVINSKDVYGRLVVVLECSEMKERQKFERTVTNLKLGDTGSLVMSV